MTKGKHLSGYEDNPTKLLLTNRSCAEKRERLLSFLKHRQVSFTDLNVLNLNVCEYAIRRFETGGFENCTSLCQVKSMGNYSEHYKI